MREMAACRGRGDDDLDRGQIEHTQKSSNGAIKLSLLLLLLERKLTEGGLLYVYKKRSLYFLYMRSSPVPVNFPVV